MELLTLLLTGGIGAAAIKLLESLTLWALSRRAAKTDGEAGRRRAKAEALDTTVKHLVAGQRIILHDRIKYLAKCYIKAGEIAIDDREDLLEMHRIYHNSLGGNGNLDAVMAQVLELNLKI